ncbi:MAG: hypothetical protein ABFD07_06815 [Methanobacterium sp.]
MMGKIAFKLGEENVFVTVEGNKVLEVVKEDVESLFTKMMYFNEDNSEMTEEEYEAFYDENSEIVELLADIEVQL